MTTPTAAVTTAAATITAPTADPTSRASRGFFIAAARARGALLTGAAPSQA